MDEITRLLQSGWPYLAAIIMVILLWRNNSYKNSEISAAKAERDLERTGRELSLKTKDEQIALLQGENSRLGEISAPNLGQQVTNMVAGFEVVIAAMKQQLAESGEQNLARVQSLEGDIKVLEDANERVSDTQAVLGKDMTLQLISQYRRAQQQGTVVTMTGTGWTPKGDEEEQRKE